MTEIDDLFAQYPVKNNLKGYTCKYCKSDKFFIKETRVHYNLFCGHCGAFNKHLSIREAQDYKHLITKSTQLF